MIFEFIILMLFCININVYAQNYVPGNVYYDSTGFVEYHAGNLPFIISVPHGGYLSPDSIPDRDCPGCKYLRDSYTQEIGRLLLERFNEKTGCYPHVVINLLHRKKFDANRNLVEASDGNPVVEKTWYGYHEFIDSAKSTISKNYSKGLFIDLHGHAHDIQRIELGYLLSKSELQLEDQYLNSDIYINKSSIRNLVYVNLHNSFLSELLRGDFSLGDILQNKGFASVPSRANPFPKDNEPYFSGGYNTGRHGSSVDGTVDAVQLELNHDIRFDDELRSVFVDSLVEALIEYYNLNYNSEFNGKFCKILNVDDVLSGCDVIKIYPNPVKNSLNISGCIKDM
ncbi:MAG TPA: hypothetical protein ENK91_14895, partial [Bacteroidetes bacterium]|nr:hypothetical protein [Bacteroidota bacterium]